MNGYCVPVEIISVPQKIRYSFTRWFQFRSFPRGSFRRLNKRVLSYEHTTCELRINSSLIKLGARTLLVLHIHKRAHNGPFPF